MAAALIPPIARSSLWQLPPALARRNRLEARGRPVANICGGVGDSITSTLRVESGSSLGKDPLAKPRHRHQRSVPEQRAGRYGRTDPDRPTSAGSPGAGPIPGVFARLTALDRLELQSNLLTGEPRGI